MDPQKRFEMKPFPLESEFRVLSIKRRISELSREDLEEFLIESLSITMKLADQVKQFQAHIIEIEGKTD